MGVGKRGEGGEGRASWPDSQQQFSRRKVVLASH